MKILGVVIIVVSIIWISAYVVFHLAMSSISDSYPQWSLMIAVLWLGPMFFLVGGSLIVIGWQCRVATILICIAALTLTIFFGYALSDSFHRQPLEPKPPYLILAVFAIVTIVSDLAAIRLFQRAWLAKRHSQ